MPNEKLKIGDPVMWSDCWGTLKPVEAIIESIEETAEPRMKYGKEVAEINWSRKDYCIVTLTNGKWAYGLHISPIVLTKKTAR